MNFGNLNDAKALAMVAAQNTTAASGFGSLDLNALGGPGLAALLTLINYLRPGVPPAAPTPVTLVQASVEPVPVIPAPVPAPIDPVPMDPAPVIPAPAPAPMPQVADPAPGEPVAAPGATLGEPSGDDCDFKHVDPETETELFDGLELEPESLEESKEPPVHMRYREPMPSPKAANSGREVCTWVNTDPRVQNELTMGKRPRDESMQPAKRARNGGGNFHDYSREDMSEEEIAASVTPEWNFNLNKRNKVSAAFVADARWKAQQRFGVKTSVQGIAAERKRWATTNSQIAKMQAAIQELQEGMKDAHQIDRVFIYLERLQKMIDPDL